MHVVVCSVIPPLFLPWQLDFASPRSHYCMNVTECFVFPSLLPLPSLLPHTCTKKLMSLSGYCVPVKCCMFLVSRITGCHEAHFQGFLDF